jgi:hypothetical protein
MKKKAKFPYGYKTIPLRSGNGYATITGKSSKELIDAVNRVAELAVTKTKTLKHGGKNITNIQAE